MTEFLGYGEIEIVIIIKRLRSYMTKQEITDLILSLIPWVDAIEYADLIDELHKHGLCFDDYHEVLRDLEYKDDYQNIVFIDRYSINESEGVTYYSHTPFG